MKSATSTMSNCLFFVIERLYRCGGYLIARKSHYGWWPHFYWSADLKTFEEFTPNALHKTSLWWPPPMYRGHINVTTSCEDLLFHLYRPAVSVT